MNRLLRCLFVLAFALSLDAQISRSRWVYVGPLSGIPAVCDPLAGSASFITDATAGGQLYACGPTANTWTQVAGSGGGGSGTVTNIATTAPITGGPITTTGTIACATCVVASSPGAGIAHFAGSTQTATSSPIVAADTDTSIAHTGVDVNTLYQVTATHLASALPINQGGTAATTQPNAAIALLPTATRAGDIIYWDGSVWNHLAGNNSGSQFLQENSSGGPTWAAGGSGTPAPTGSVLFATTATAAVTATSATTLVNTSGAVGSQTLAANFFTVGQTLMVLGEGVYSTPATATSLTIDFKLGGSTVVSTGSITTLASVTNGTWRFSCMATDVTTGSSGTLRMNCIFEMAPSSVVTLSPAEGSMALAGTFTINTTTTNLVDLQATWSTATGSPTITATNFAYWAVGGTVTNVSASAPITVSNGATTPALACPTCATTTNGGALSGTSPIAVSAAGSISCTTCAVTGGNTFTGAQDFTGATPTVPTAAPGTNTTAAASTAFVTAAVTGAAVTTYTSTGANTFTKPTLCNTIEFVIWGGGGSGAGGATKATSATVTLGGTGGGGGAKSRLLVKCSDLTAPIVVNVGAGGAAVAAATNGNPGGNSSVTSNGVQILFAGGGGAGFTSTGTASISGGSGGGAIGIGVIGGTGNNAGGAPSPASGAGGIAGQGAGDTIGAAGGNAEWGGAAGGGVSTGGGFDGGSSIYGGPGGGSGGTVTSGSSATTGKAGGAPQSYIVAGGSAGGAACNANNCTATNGTAGTAGNSQLAGSGGGGGGACFGGTAATTCTAGNGMAGGAPGAGGGGGGAADTNAGTSNAGTGGAGGNGYAIVIVN